MKKVFTVFIFAIISFKAVAAQLTVTVAVTGQGTFNQSYTLADADVARIIAAYQIQANAATNAPATRNQVLQYWVKQKLVTQTVQDVQSYETQTAIQALPVISPINPQ